jgi:hypothetical protein
VNKKKRNLFHYSSYIGEAALALDDGVTAYRSLAEAGGFES